MNNDGLMNSNDVVLSNMLVVLYNKNGQIIQETRSNVDGEYQFEDVFPGVEHVVGVVSGSEYRFSSVVVSGGNQMTQLDDEQGTSQPITINEGDFKDDVHAGVWRFASVGDLLFYDTNGNGIQNEDPLVGFPFPVTINLYKGTNGQFLASTENDEFGFYAFSNLMPGSYEIEYIIDDTEIFSPPFQGTNGGLDSDVNPDTGRAQVSLVSGEINANVDVGIIGEAPYYPDWEYFEQVCTNE